MITDTKRRPELEEMTVGIYGFGNTGQTLVRELSRSADRIIVYEDDPSDTRPSDLETVNGAVRWVESPTVLHEIPDLLISSPGIPGDHPVLRQAREFGIPVWDEIELGYRLTENGTFWAITGTNGKSTAAELAGRVLEAEYGENRVRVCGNRGSPLVENLADDGSEYHYVVEVSSFQVEGLDTFAPDGALLTSLGDDHREYHNSRYEYRALKFDLLRRVVQGGPMVVPSTEEHHSWLKRHAGKRSFDERGARDVDVERTSDGRIRYENKDVRLDELSSSLSMFPENIMGVASLLHDNVSPESFIEGLRSFESLKYRAGRPEIVGERQVINDSKATNPTAVQKLLARLDEPFHLVLGGGAKNTDYGSLVDELVESEVVGMTLAGSGSTVERLKPLLRERGLDFREEKLWKDAVQSAYRDTSPGHVLVLSPGGTSFDAFDHYRDRGQSFDRWIGEAADEN